MLNQTPKNAMQPSAAVGVTQQEEEKEKKTEAQKTAAQAQQQQINAANEQSVAEMKQQEVLRMQVLRKALELQEEDLNQIEEQIPQFKDLSEQAQGNIKRLCQAQKILPRIMRTGIYRDSTNNEEEQVTLSQNAQDESAQKRLEECYIVVDDPWYWRTDYGHFLQDEKTKTTLVKGHRSELSQKAINSFADLHAAKFISEQISTGDALPCVKISGFNTRTRYKLAFAFLQRGIIPILPNIDLTQSIPSEYLPHWYQWKSRSENSVLANPPSDKNNPKYSNDKARYDTYVAKISDPHICQTMGDLFELSKKYWQEALFSMEETQARSQETKKAGQIQVEKDTKIPTLTGVSEKKPV